MFWSMGQNVLLFQLHVLSVLNHLFYISCTSPLICCLFLFCFLGPGPVQDLSVVSINETTFYISFTTPINPNGMIKEYQIIVANTLSAPANFTAIISHTEGVDEYFTFATRLG